MRQYETMYILRPGAEEEATNEMVEKFKNVIETQGGAVDRIERWGKRKLAYEIDKEREGHYVLMYFKAAVPAVTELDRMFKISGEVLRHIIIRED
ncbi:MAG: 30S ribosomal protein S6 [Ammonifex sp.]|nr:MAG: 30S ribosomal protein S6 [Ammonifex sp.]